MTRYDRIKRLCKKNGFTVTGLEKQLGFARGSLCKINVSQPSAEKLFLLAETLNTTPDYLLTGEDDESSEGRSMNIDERIQALIDDLTGDSSAYCYGEVMSEEGKLALLNSLKQDKEFLTALYKKK